MDIPSPGRIMVELQKAATRGHRLLLQSPLGPLVSTTPFGRFLILHTTGRRSGQPRKTPLSYTRDGDTYIVIASDGGSSHHPDWYLNLQGDPVAEVEVGGHRSQVHAETVTNDERDRLWRRAVASYPGYAGYQARTDRQIPVVRLSPTAEQRSSSPAPPDPDSAR
jgi:F420H(2)-dependent quinone reductase